MMIKRAVLDRIRAGEVDLAFRYWRRPTVKTCGRLRTAVGELAIDDVSVVSEASLTQDDARRAGYRTLDDLKSDLSRRQDGDLYRIEMRYQATDRRKDLREDDKLSDAECFGLLKKLARLGRTAAMGSVSLKVLDLIARRPERRAQDLAEELGMEKHALKRHVRKLKEHGLTESMDTGYRLSPRGERLLRFSQSLDRPS